MRKSASVNRHIDMTIEHLSVFCRFMKTLTDDEVYQRIAKVMAENDHKAHAVVEDDNDVDILQIGTDMIADFIDREG